jgi:hypothetical protein
MGGAQARQEKSCLPEAFESDEKTHFFSTSVVAPNKGRGMSASVPALPPGDWMYEKEAFGRRKGAPLDK